MLKESNHKKISIFFYLIIAEVSVILFCMVIGGLLGFLIGVHQLDQDVSQFNLSFTLAQLQKRHLLRQIVLTILGCGVPAILATCFIARKLSKTLNNFTDKLKNIAGSKGDLTQRICTGPSIAEIASAEVSFNQIQDNYRNTLKSVLKVTDVLNDFGQKLLTSSASVSAGVKKVSEVMAEVNHNAEIQVANTSRLTGVMHDISVSSVEAASTASEAQKVSLHSKQAAENGQAPVKETLALLIQIEHFAGKLKDLSNDLNARSAQIRQILDILIYVSRQTKILALNANIEAAKAGETGRGFAVVAQQIRDLADNSQDSIGDIAERINEVRKALAETVSLVGSFYELVEQGGSKIMEAESQLVEIQKSSDSSLSLVNRLSQLVERQTSPIEEVANLIQALAQFNQQFSSSGRSIAMTTDTQKNVLESVLMLAKDTEMAVQELHQLIEEYKL